MNNDKEILEESEYITQKELQLYFIFGTTYPEVGKRLNELLEMAKGAKTKQIIQNIIEERNKYFYRKI